MSIACFTTEAPCKPCFDPCVGQWVELKSLAELANSLAQSDLPNTFLNVPYPGITNIS